MKKLMKNFLCMLIVFFILITYIIPIYSYAITSDTKYLALGDSIAYGYGLANKDNDSYAAKLKANYNIKDNDFKNLAISGMTCQEFYSKIQENDYTNALKSANLVTISIGSNELLRIVGKAISSVTGIPSSDPNLTEKAQEIFMNANLIEKYMMISSIYDYFTSEETKIVIETAIKTYQEYWKKSINYIRQINPNIIIVATEFYNPYYEVALLQYDLGGFVDEYVVKMNNILHEESNLEKDYKIAKIYSAFNKTNPRVTNVNIDFSSFNLDPHPNKLGHEIISTKIIDELSKVEVDEKTDISTLTINEIEDQDYTGKEIKPEIIIKYKNKRLVENIDYTVSYTNNINIGKANVIIIGIGNYNGKVEKTFNIKEVDIKKSIENLSIENVEEQTYLGSQITPKVIIKNNNNQLEENKDYELKYKNNINVGEATIIITGIGNYNESKNVNFEIVPKDINDIDLQDIPDQLYTGKEIKPELVLLHASIKLIKDKDYTVTYKNNVNKGEAEIQISGKGNYKGTVTKKFNIIENQEEELKDIVNLEITDIEQKIYTGKLITPEVRIKDNEKVLIKNKDYKISYIDNINIGTGKAIITGIGLYKGKVEKTFKIIKKDINYTTINDIIDQEYTGKEIEPEVIIYNDGILLEKNKDYTIKFFDNKQIGTVKIQIDGIGNFTGTAIKTFNIISNDVKKEEQSKQNEIKEDNTIADKVLPNTGKKVGLYLVIFTVLGIIFYFRLRKYKKLKI